MTWLDKLLTHNYRLLKLVIIISVLILIFITEVINFFYFKKPIASSVFDSITIFIISLIILKLTFFTINKKEEQLNQQVNQLTDAYTYIGKINRKIDALLDLDISSLDQSKNKDLRASSESIFNQLISLINACEGILILKHPFNIKVYRNFYPNHDQDIKPIIEELVKNNIRHFYFSQNPNHKYEISKLGVDKQIFKKFNLILKPVYMHDKDIGQMVIVLDAKEEIEERDLNIIRVFSFYLALNTTFKPEILNQKN